MASFLSGNSRWYLNLSISEQSYNAAGNYSTVAWSASVSKNTSGYDGSAAGTLSWSTTRPDGSTNSGSIYYSSGARDVSLESGTSIVYHDANGAGSAGYSANSSGDVGPSSTVYEANGSVGVGLTDFDRSPTTPSLSLARNANGSTVTASWSGSVNNSGPAVTFNLDRYTGASTSPPGGWATPQASGAYSGTFTESGLDVLTDYSYRIYAYNTDGAKASAWQIAYAPPQFSTFTLPQGVLGKTYSGQVTGTRVGAFAISSGALPDGLSMNSSGVISGTPTKPGTFTFTVAASNNWGTQTSSTQSIFIAAGGPWVKTAATVVNATISNIAVTSGVATITTSAAHNITQINQPITISGLTGSGAALNGARIVTSYTSNTFTFATTAGNIASTSASGTAISYFKRSMLYVRQGGQWVAAYLRVYQASSSSWVFIK